MQLLATIDPDFTYNITHDSDNNVPGIVWMMPYMREMFEIFGSNLSIGVMKTQVCNAKEFCSIASVMMNEIGKINVMCEGFVILKTHDAYCFILNSLFKMCIGRGGNEVYAIRSHEFMTKSLLESIGMKDTKIC